MAAGGKWDGCGSLSAFEHQARTIGRKQPLLVASGKTEPKGAGLGPTPDCTFPNPHECSPLSVLTLTSSFLSSPLVQNPKFAKTQQVIQVGVFRFLFNSSGFAFFLRN